MSWLDDSASWRTSARRWLPERVAPLRLRVWLTSPVAWDPYGGITIEGALQSVVVTRESGMLPADAFADAPSDFFADVPVPIADEEHAGKLIACASWAVPQALVETVRKVRRRTREELFPTPGGKGLLVTGGGPYKNTEIPIATVTTPYVEFFVRGDRSKLADLVRDVGSIGRSRAGGLGAVHGVEIDEDPDDRSLVYRGRPQRTIPVADEHDAAVLFEASSYDLREANTRAPYWHRATRALCAVPMPSAFTKEVAA